jgi:hemolysin type calcium-binding protein
MRALLVALIAALAVPAAASAEVTATVIGGELRIVGDDERQSPLMTVESERWFNVPADRITVSDPGACDGGGLCHVSMVRRVVLELRGGDDTQHMVETAGRPAEWFGGDGNDSIGSTDGDDVAHGEAGHDILDDNVNLEPSGDDLLDGGPGHDQLFASEGRDRMVGGPGNDHFYAGSGGDEVDGGPGNDRIWLFFGPHRKVNAGPGNDRVRGGKGPDVIDCGPGRDTVDLRWGGRDRTRNCERRIR